MLVNDRHGLSGDEHAISAEGAEGEEICIRADAIKGREMTRIFGHGGRAAIGAPNGPAKAGPYLRILNFVQRGGGV